MSRADIPVKKNAKRVLEIENVNAKGFGIGRADGYVLLVENALPGDKLEVRVLKIKARYGYAKMVRIIRPSPHRVESPCPVAATCGGCQFQHCAYTAQLALKKQTVVDALERIGGIEAPPVKDVLGMDAPARYRNKVVFPVVPSGNADGFEIGLYAARSHRVVEIADCYIQHPAHIRVLSVIKSHMRRHKITPYDEISHQGLMRRIMVRTSLATGEIMVIPVINGTKLPAETALAKALTHEAQATTILINAHTARGNAVLGTHFRVLTGSGYIEEAIGDVRYRISAPSFFQINPAQVQALYDAALEMAGITANKNELNILDAHAGAGGIALYAAKHAAQVIGIDIAAPAIADATKNAALNGVDNARFITGAAEEVIPALLSPNAPQPFRPDVVFLDPPRRGCDAALLDALIAAHIPRIVYISCDPATLARDVKHLQAGGYTLATVQPVDMFPMTGHVECVAGLY